MSFNIQDYNGNDVNRRILTMVELYLERTGERIAAYPWTMRTFGDLTSIIHSERSETIK